MLLLNENYLVLFYSIVELARDKFSNHHRVLYCLLFYCYIFRYFDHFVYVIELSHGFVVSCSSEFQCQLGKSIRYIFYYYHYCHYFRSRIKMNERMITRKNVERRITLLIFTHGAYETYTTTIFNT